MVPRLSGPCFAPHVQAINNTDFAASSVSGSPHFGDIMGGTEGKGADLLHHFEPLERVILTANGNLQRVVRSACRLFFFLPCRVKILPNCRSLVYCYDSTILLYFVFEKSAVAADPLLDRPTGYIKCATE